MDSEARITSPQHHGQPSAQLAAWLEARLGSYHVDTTVHGTYGTVLLLTADENVSPGQLAAKTFRDVSAAKASPREVRDLFTRELELWFRIPKHQNVLSPYRILFADLEDEVVPIVTMPRMEHSLELWLQQGSVSTVDKLLALVQVVNGLAWSYDHGIEGHGDLKPANVLLNPVGEMVWEDHGEYKGPRWIARVADFGWADIWRVFAGEEYAAKGWKPYLSPERLHGVVVPRVSDMFAVGVIGTELLTGLHPMGKPVEAVNKVKRAKYQKWAESGERTIDSDGTDATAQVLRQCLAPNPEDRPSPREVVSRLCRELHVLGHEHAELYLDSYNENAKRLEHPTTRRWTLEHVSSLGSCQLDAGIEELRAMRKVEPFPAASEDVARWLDAGCGLARLLVRRNRNGDLAEAADVCLELLRYLSDHAKTLDLRSALWSDPTSGELAVSDLLRSEVVADFVRVSVFLLRELGRWSDYSQRLLDGINDAARVESLAAWKEDPFWG